MIEGKEQIKDDLIVMSIDDDQEITKEYVTAKYRKLAKLNGAVSLATLGADGAIDNAGRP